MLICNHWFHACHYMAIIKWKKHLFLPDDLILLQVTHL